MPKMCNFDSCYTSWVPKLHCLRPSTKHCTPKTQSICSIIQEFSCSLWRPQFCSFYALLPLDLRPPAQTLIMKLCKLFLGCCFPEAQKLQFCSNNPELIADLILWRWKTSISDIGFCSFEAILLPHQNNGLPNLSIFCTAIHGLVHHWWTNCTMVQDHMS